MILPEIIRELKHRWFMITPSDIILSLVSLPPLIMVSKGIKSVEIKS